MAPQEKKNFFKEIIGNNVETFMRRLAILALLGVMSVGIAKRCDSSTEPQKDGITLPDIPDFPMPPTSPNDPYATDKAKLGGTTVEEKAWRDNHYLKDIPVTKKLTEEEKQAIGAHAEYVVYEDKALEMVSPEIEQELKKCPEAEKNDKASKKAYKACFERTEAHFAELQKNDPDLPAKEGGNTVGYFAELKIEKDGHTVGYFAELKIEEGGYSMYEWGIAKAAEFFSKNPDELKKNLEWRTNHELMRAERGLPVELTLAEYAHNNLIALAATEGKYPFAYSRGKDRYQKDYKTESWDKAEKYFATTEEGKAFYAKNFRRKLNSALVSWVETFKIRHPEGFFYLPSWGTLFPYSSLERMRRDFSGDGADFDKFMMEQPTIPKDCNGNPIYMQEMQPCYLAKSDAEIYTDIYQTEDGKVNGKCLADTPGHRHCARTPKQNAIIKVDNPHYVGGVAGGYHGVGAATDLNPWQQLQKPLSKKDIRVGCYGTLSVDDAGHASHHELNKSSAPGWTWCMTKQIAKRAKDRIKKRWF